MAVIKLGQLLHRATTAPIDENNPLNVALSGNIVEELIVRDFTIAAGGTVSIGLVDLKKDGGYTKFTIGVRTSDPHKFEILVSHILDSGLAIAYRDLEYSSPEKPTDFGCTEVIQAKAGKVRVDIRNLDTSSRTYSVYITKMR